VKIVGYFIGACILLAIARATAAAIILCIILAIVIGAICKPRETFGLLAFLLLANLFAAYPVGFLIVVGLIAAVAIIKSHENT
jgi:hypothetical protein